MMRPANGVALSGMALLTSTALLLPSCAREPRAPIEPSVEFVLPRARWLEATTVARVRIENQSALTYRQTCWRRSICAYHESGSVVEILDGESIERDFVSDGPLETGEEYLVAILDTGDPAPASAYHPGISERALRYALCRDQLPHHALGWARIRVVGGEERVVVPSNLVPAEVESTAIDGTVGLAGLIEAGLRIRAGRTERPGQP